MSYHHFTIEERCCLREYYKKGYSYRKIAELMGRNVSSISRELRRNCTHMYDIPTYYPHTAQKKSDLRRSYCHRGMFWQPEMIKYIEDKLLAHGHRSKSHVHHPLLQKCHHGERYIVGYMINIF